jgi:hypothetical protein
VTFLYLDASAWVKRYYREPGSERLQELLVGADQPACSVLGVVEVIATLARKCKAQEITRGDFEAKLAEIEADWRSFVQIELTASSLELAKDAAVRFALRGADAVHFAALQSLAQRVSGSGHRVVLVASDRELKDATQASGITVVDPESI